MIHLCASPSQIEWKRIRVWLSCGDGVCSQFQVSLTGRQNDRMKCRPCDSTACVNRTLPIPLRTPAKIKLVFFSNHFFLTNSHKSISAVEPSEESFLCCTANPFPSGQIINDPLLQMKPLVPAVTPTHAGKVPKPYQIKISCSSTQWKSHVQRKVSKESSKSRLTSF